MIHNNPRDPATMWQIVLGELELQMPRQTFDTWLRDTRLLGVEDGVFTIAAHNIYQREWLEHRLQKAIVRSLSQVAGQAISVQFVLLPEPDAAQPDLHSAGPLLAAIAPADEILPFEPHPIGETGLNPRLSFANFATGDGNRVAGAALQAAASRPGQMFNPIAIYGEVGMGKSHLLHAAGNACREAGGRVLYASAETFTNDLIGAIRAHRTDAFREKYRSVDMLLIDNVQFLAGKASTQEEFYHTFESLYHTGAQIVVASSLPPFRIQRLDDRLRSRFEGGLLAELASPDYATRMAILRMKAQERGLLERFPLETLEELAMEVEGSIRDLEGALNRMIAVMMVWDETLPMADLVEMALSQRPAAAALSIEDVITAVAHYYGVTPEQILGRDRSREISIARQVVMYLARHTLDLSFPQIGEALGGRNHTTVMYAYERVVDLLTANSHLRQQVHAIQEALGSQRRVRSG